MAKMCPLDGCKTKKGLCIHDKMMIGVTVMVLAGLVVYLSGILG